MYNGTNNQIVKNVYYSVVCINTKRKYLERKELKTMKEKYTVFTETQELEIKSMLKEIETGFPNAEITFDESMLEVFRRMIGTDDDITFLTEEVIEKVSWAYAEYLMLRMIKRLPRNHKVNITVYAEGDATFDISTKIESEQDIFDAIKNFDEMCVAADAFSRGESFENYLPGNVTVDGIDIVKNGMIIIPDDADVSYISKKEIERILEQYHMSISVEEARLLLVDRVLQLPLKEDVNRWVLDKFNSFEAIQPDSETGRKDIRFVHERVQRFMNVFEKLYDEKKLVAIIMNYYGMLKHAPDNLVIHGCLQKEIVRNVATLLLVIYSMTEYDVSGCF